MLPKSSFMGAGDLHWAPDSRVALTAAAEAAQAAGGWTADRQRNLRIYLHWWMLPSKATEKIYFEVCMQVLARSQLRKQICQSTSCCRKRLSCCKLAASKPPCLQRSAERRCALRGSFGVLLQG
jgi:hypothetical protein